MKTQFYFQSEQGTIFNVWAFNQKEANAKAKMILPNSKLTPIK